MPLDFQRRSTPPEQRVGRRAPPNYFSRHVQRRLLFMFGSLMLVLIIVPKIREPRFWDFMGFQRPIAGGPPLAPHEIVTDDIDTSLRPKGDAPGTAPTDSTDSSNQGKKAIALPQPDEDGDWSTLEMAEWDAWVNVLGGLNGDEQLLLYAVLDHRLLGQSLSAADREGWGDLVRRLDERWSRHLEAAALVLKDLPAEESTRWTGVLDDLRKRWTDQIFPQFQQWLTHSAGSAATGSPAAVEKLPPTTEKPLEARLQKALDVATRAAIQDDMVQRPQEKAAWFRYFQEVRTQSPELLKSRSAGPTGFLPLYKQSADYRGKVVTVRGVVRLAYQVDAPPNRAGISSYYLFWVHPAGGPNSPLVVYCLDLPAGFPPVKNKDRDRGTTPLNEEVEFTGVFFKRWAYESQGGIHVAPLLLARSPQWQGSASPSEELTMTKLVLLVSGTAVAGSLVAWFLFRRAGDTNRAAPPVSTTPFDSPAA